MEGNLKQQMRGEFTVLSQSLFTTKEINQWLHLVPYEYRRAKNKDKNRNKCNIKQKN